MELWSWIMVWYAPASVVTFCVYAWDKRQARAGGRRVPENTLHLLALLGGWPGAHAARVMLRHKTRKRGFGVLLWAITLLHAAGLLLILFKE